MNVQEILEKWLFNKREVTPLWHLSITEIEYASDGDPIDGVEIAALAENIRQCGLLQPILVEKQRTGKKYRLIAGKRRLEAFKLLGRMQISAIVVKCGDASPLKLALSEIMMRKRPHFLDLADDLQTLLKATSMSEMTRLFSVPESSLQQKLVFTVLSPYEKRLVRLLRLTEEETVLLCEIENSALRKLILEKMAQSGSSHDYASLIKQAVSAPDSRLTQSEKVYVSDIRIFLNTVERAAELMRSAGFATDIERFDGGDNYQFTITVAKSKFVPTAATQHPFDTRPNVSRETSLVDCANVSRETHENMHDSIDETDDSCYNKEVQPQTAKLQ